MHLGIVDIALSVLGLAMLALAWSMDWIRPRSFARARRAEAGGAGPWRIGAGPWLAAAGIIFGAMVLGGALAFGLIGGPAAAEGIPGGQGPQVTLEEMALLMAASMLLPAACALAAVEMLRTRWVQRSGPGEEAGADLDAGAQAGLERAGLAWGLDRYGLASAAVGTAVIVPVCMLAAVLVSLSYTLITGERPGAIAHESLRAFADGVREPGGWVWAAVLAAVAITLTPLVEDVLFRVCVQSAAVAAARGARVWTPIFISSAVFTGMHVGMVEPHAMPMLFVLGIGLGIAYQRTGRVMVPVMIHGAYNGVMLLAVVLIAPV